jgi:hypothetical protein
MEPLSTASASPFDFLMPESRQWFRLGEVAQLIGMSEGFVEKLYDEGTQLSGHEFNAGTGQRLTKRVPRAFVVALLIKSARYEAGAKLPAFLSCLREFTPEELSAIAAAAGRICAEKIPTTGGKLPGRPI